MFEYCDKLLSFSDNHKRNKDHIIYISGDNENNNSLNTENSESYSSKSFIYHSYEKELTSLSSIRNISNDPNSITLSHICKKKDLLIKVINMNSTFSGCNSLISMPDKLYCNTFNTTKMCKLFF